MIENAEHGQAIGKNVSRARVHEHRLGLDPKLPKDSDEQGRLGLAVAEAAAPRRFGGGRDVAPLAHKQRHVPDSILHERKRLLGLGALVARLADLLHLVAQSAGRGNYAGRAKMGTDELGDLRP